MLPRNLQKSTCLVVPLDQQQKPYKSSLSPTDNINNSLVFNLEILSARQAEFAVLPRLSWQEVLQQHITTEAKIKIKDMQEYGLGAFVKKKILRCEYVIYPGQMVESLDSDVPQADRIYYLNIPNTSLCFDPKYTNCVAKYFQHLPKFEPAVIVDFDEETAAKENFASTVGCVKIELDEENYLVPLRLFAAVCDIEADSMVGFDYGKKYWKSLNRSFSYFTNTGIPIKAYCILVDEYKYMISQNAFLNLIKHGLYINQNRILILPREVKDSLQTTLAQGGEASHALPINSLRLKAVIEFRLDACTIIYKEENNKKHATSVLVKLGEVTLIRSRPIYAYFADNDNYSAPAPIQAISIKILSTTSLDNLTELRNSLNRIGYTGLVLRIQKSEKDFINGLLDQGIFNAKQQPDKLALKHPPGSPRAKI